MYPHPNENALKDILVKLHGIKAIVDKTRRIYFIENVKFHFDVVLGLGNFIEVEAIDETGEIGIDKLKKQCDYYASYFSIEANDYVDCSYSDLILEAGRL